MVYLRDSGYGAKPKDISRLYSLRKTNDTHGSQIGCDMNDIRHEVEALQPCEVPECRVGSRDGVGVLLTDFQAKRTYKFDSYTLWVEEIGSYFGFEDERKPRKPVVKLDKTTDPQISHRTSPPQFSFQLDNALPLNWWSMRAGYVRTWLGREKGWGGRTGKRSGGLGWVTLRETPAQQVGSQTVPNNIFLRTSYTTPRSICPICDIASGVFPANRPWESTPRTIVIIPSITTKRPSLLTFSFFCHTSPPTTSKSFHCGTRQSHQNNTTGPGNVEITLVVLFRPAW